MLSQEGDQAAKKKKSGKKGKKARAKAAAAEKALVAKPTPDEEPKLDFAARFQKRDFHTKLYATSSSLSPEALQSRTSFAEEDGVWNHQTDLWLRESQLHAEQWALAEIAKERMRHDALHPDEPTSFFVSGGLMPEFDPFHLHYTQKPPEDPEDLKEQYPGEPPEAIEERLEKKRSERNVVERLARIVAHTQWERVAQRLRDMRSPQLSDVTAKECRARFAKTFRAFEAFEASEKARHNSFGKKSNRGGGPKEPTPSPGSGGGGAAASTAEGSAQAAEGPNNQPGQEHQGNDGQGQEAPRSEGGEETATGGTKKERGDDGEGRKGRRPAPSSKGRGDAALACACLSGRSVGTAELLINMGSDLDMRSNSDGATPLLRACEGGNPHIVKLLLDKGCDRAAEDRLGRNAVHVAGMFKWLDLVEVLLDEGAPRCSLNRGQCMACKLTMKLLQRKREERRAKLLSSASSSGGEGDKGGGGGGGGGRGGGKRTTRTPEERQAAIDAALAAFEAEFGTFEDEVNSSEGFGGGGGGAFSDNGGSLGVVSSQPNLGGVSTGE